VKHNLTDIYDMKTTIKSNAFQSKLKTGNIIHGQPMFLDKSKKCLNLLRIPGLRIRLADAHFDPEGADPGKILAR